MSGILETITGIAATALNQVTAQAFTPNSPNTFAVRSATGQRDALLLSAWANTAADAGVRVRSARLHDSQQGINMRALAGNAEPILTAGLKQGLYSQDVLTVEVTPDAAGAAATHGVALQVFYPDLLGGSSAQFRSWAEVEPNIVNVYGQQVAPVSAAAVGLWGAAAVINTLYDQFKAGKKYALLGYVTSVMGVAFGILGADTGNYLVGGPMTTDAKQTRDYFIDLSEKNGIPLIPIISADNKLATTVQVATLVAATAAPISLIFAELSA